MKFVFYLFFIEFQYSSLPKNIQASNTNISICSNKILQRYFKKEEKYSFFINLSRYYSFGLNYQSDLLEGLNFFCTQEQKQKIRNCLYFRKKKLTNMLYKTSFLDFTELQILNEKYNTFSQSMEYQEYGLCNKICKSIIEIDFKSPTIKKEIADITFIKIKSIIYKQSAYNYTCFCLMYLNKEFIQNCDKLSIDKFLNYMIVKFNDNLQNKKLHYKVYYNESDRKILKDILKIFEDCYDINKIFLINNLKYFQNMLKSKTFNNLKAQIMNELINKLFIIISRGFPRIIFTDHFTYKNQMNIYMENQFHYFENFKTFEFVIGAISLFLQKLLFFTNKIILMQKLQISLESLLSNQKVTDDPNINSIIKHSSSININANIQNLSNNILKNTLYISDLNKDNGLLTKNDLIEIFIEIIMKQIKKFFQKNNISIKNAKNKAKFLLAYHSYLISNELGFDDFLIGKTEDLEMCFFMSRSKIESFKKADRYKFDTFLNKFIDYCIYGQAILAKKFEIFHEHYENINFYTDNFGFF